MTHSHGASHRGSRQDAWGSVTQFGRFLMILIQNLAQPALKFSVNFPAVSDDTNWN